VIYLCVCVCVCVCVFVCVVEFNDGGCYGSSTLEVRLRRKKNRKFKKLFA